MTIPTPRTSYPLNASFPGTDVMAAVSSAFSLGSLLYSNATLNTTSNSHSPPLGNSSYSSTLLSHATALYNAANNLDFTLWSRSLPNLPYASSGYQDDLTLAALSLALATNNSQYYHDAWVYYSNFTLTGYRGVFNWDSKVPAVFVMFVEAATARPGLAIGAGLSVNLTGWRTEAEGYFDSIVSGSGTNGNLTSGEQRFLILTFETHPQAVYYTTTEILMRHLCNLRRQLLF